MHQSHVNGNLPCDVVKMSQPIALLYNWEQLRGELQIGKNQDQRQTDRENALSSEVHLLLDAFFFRCVFRCVFLLTHNSEFPPCRNQGSGSKQKEVTDPLHPNSPTQHSGSTPLFCFPGSYTTIQVTKVLTAHLWQADPKALYSGRQMLSMSQVERLRLGF